MNHLRTNHMDGRDFAEVADNIQLVSIQLALNPVCYDALYRPDSVAVGRG